MRELYSNMMEFRQGRMDVYGSGNMGKREGSKKGRKTGAEAKGTKWKRRSTKEEIEGGRGHR